jgi:hypothetical protein
VQSFDKKTSREEATLKMGEEGIAINWLKMAVFWFVAPCKLV